MDNQNQSQTYPFKNTPLPYGYGGLEPYIDARTMMLHHDRHLQTYIDNLNKYLEDKPELQHLTLQELIVQYGHDETIRRNAGGVFNHEFFFSTLRPGMSQIVIGLSGKLWQAIQRDFGSLEDFKEKFTSAAMSVFGSGYAWLCVNPRDKLVIVTSANQDTPFNNSPFIEAGAPKGWGMLPLLCIDVWEHAYYLKHYNERAAYIRDFWNVVDWVKVSARI